LLSPEIKTAVLSRGYKRKTTGYIFADDTANADKIGDEPYQIFKKHKHEAAVAVSENRILGIPNLLYDAQETQVVLLDDAFQHRAVKPGMNILLSDYNRMFTHDFIAPMGNLREYRNAYKRADAIVVTKCPEQLNQTKAKEIIESIKPYAHQKVYFSFQRYGELIGVYDKDNSYDNSNEFGVLLFAGIAQISSLDQYIKSQFKEVETIHFNDHQSYGDEELKRIIYGYEHLKSSQKIIITTEKDAVKLLKSASVPMAVLKPPDVFNSKVALPKPTLFEPESVEVNALVPKAEFCAPVVKEDIAPEPTRVLYKPEPPPLPTFTP
jgi:tetraacyldisaccharide 4'-kinase